VWTRTRFVAWAAATSSTAASRRSAASAASAAIASASRVSARRFILSNSRASASCPCPRIQRYARVHIQANAAIRARGARKHHGVKDTRHDETPHSVLLLAPRASKTRSLPWQQWHRAGCLERPSEPAGRASRRPVPRPARPAAAGAPPPVPITLPDPVNIVVPSCESRKTKSVKQGHTSVSVRRTSAAPRASAASRALSASRRAASALASAA
jgi:hypothetical protein